jgi:thiamine biosynthesis lipoprotein
MDALDEAERLERELSVFRFDSKVQYINLTAFDAPVKVDEEFFALLSLCLDVAAKTGGAVDITSGPLWRTWGFARREGQIPKEDELTAALENVNYRFVQLNAEDSTVAFTKKGVEINFGCVGKGFAVDTGAKKLREQGVAQFLFQGGLSSVLAEGTDWTIGIANPLRAGQRLAELTLRNEAVGTSGSDKQFFRHRGHRYSHLIDPRTGRPAEGVFSVTVVAPNGTLAELLSTAFFVMGFEKAAECCERDSNEWGSVAAVFIVPTKGGNFFEVKQFGFPDGKLRFV